MNPFKARKAASSVIRFAILALVIGHSERKMNFLGVDAFRTRPSTLLCPGQKRTQARILARRTSLWQPLLNSQLTDGISSCGRRITTTRILQSSVSKPVPQCALFASNEDRDGTNSNRIQERLQQAFLPSLSVLWWPLFAAMGIPALVSFCRSFPPNSAEQFAAVTLLIATNRIYLYALGLTIVATASFRGRNDPKELGQRLTVLTEELLVLDSPLRVEAETVEDSSNTASRTKTAVAPFPAPAPSFVKKMVDDSGLEENLDGVDAKTQALVLPALVAGLLAISVVSLPFFTEGLLGSSPADTASLDVEWIADLQASLSKILPFLSQAWNAILLTLFARAEFRRLGAELFGISSGELSTDEMTPVPKAQIVAECLLAVAVTGYGAYYLQYWPAQNFVNYAIAVLVARAIRLDSFNAVVSALVLLALYDGASVLLIPGAANAAMDAAVSSVGAAASETNKNMVDASSMALAVASNSVSSSAMGSVAMQKLTSGGFQPGLLVTKLDGNKITGTLGLGDAVFPSILASFLKRFDEDCNKNNSDDNHQSRLFQASLGGYVVGCLACELVPSIATRGVPALVFIVPFMGLATVLSAVQAGRFEELRQYNNNEATE